MSSRDSSSDQSYVVSYIPSTNTSLASTDLSANLSQIVDDHSMSFVHKDSEADTVLVERQCPSASTLGLQASHLDSIDTSSIDSTVLYDWQKYQSLQSVSHHEPVQLPDDLLELPDQEIRQQL